jgi:AraC-like DNA-binding protein
LFATIRGCVLPGKTDEQSAIELADGELFVARGCLANGQMKEAAMRWTPSSSRERIAVTRRQPPKGKGSMRSVEESGLRNATAKEHLADFVRRLPCVSTLCDGQYIDALVEALYDDIRRFYWFGSLMDQKEHGERMMLFIDESRRQAPAIRATMNALSSVVDVTRKMATVPKAAAFLPVRVLHPGIRRAVDLMQKSYREDLSIRDLAASASLGKSQFMAAFKRETGMTPHDYIRRIRVNAAIKLLSAGEDVTRTCFEVGFSSLSGFRKAFVELAGMLPSEFRAGVRTRN